MKYSDNLVIENHILSFDVLANNMIDIVTYLLNIVNITSTLQNQYDQSYIGDWSEQKISKTISHT